MSLAPHNAIHSTAGDVLQWINAALQSSYSKPLQTPALCAMSFAVSLSLSPVSAPWASSFRAVPRDRFVAITTTLSHKSQSHRSPDEQKILTRSLRRYPAHYLLPSLLLHRPPSHTRRPWARATLCPRCRNRNSHRSACGRPRASARNRAPSVAQFD